MTLISYGHQKAMGTQRLADIERANAIIEDVGRQGYTLTLRQLYYQHVAKGLIENSERSYKNLGQLIADGRLHGLISWDAIEDRGRGVKKFSFCEDVQSALDGIEWAITVDYWERQPIYIETWVEKDALSEVVEKACEPLRVPHMACKGYLSLSEAWQAGQRFAAAAEQGKHLVLLHLGDHDPSGLDMTRVNGEQLTMFSECEDIYGESIEVVRLALNMDQVRQYNPPPNPAKMTDSRANGYVELYGKSSWELDALHPRVIHKLIEDEIRARIDDAAWEAAADEERDLQSKLIKLRKNWSDVDQFLETI